MKWIRPRFGSSSRTLLAAILVSVTVVVPCAAWYVSGAREAAREAERIQSEPARRARELAEKIAEQLRRKLEGIRESESRRPYYHYQNLYHDPKGASQGVSVVPSPLARGPEEPLVAAHFQRSPAGRITLPAINEDVPELSAAPGTAELAALKRSLDAASDAIGSALPPAPQALADATPPRQEQRQAVESLEPQQYQQNLQANQIYQSIKNKAPQAVSLPRGLGRKEQASVTVRTDPFAWRTVTLQGAPALFALRTVATPEGTLAQGFLVKASAVADWLGTLGEGGLGARLVEGEARETTEAPVRLEGAVWRVAVDPGSAIGETKERAAAVLSRFRREFVATALLAAAAGLVLLLLVYQSERFARQRSLFAASAAHELRTPLAGLRMYGEMLADGLGDPAKAKEYAGRMAQEADRLSRIVNNVLSFTHVERGSLTVARAPGDIAASVCKILVQMAPALTPLDAGIEMAISEDIPPVSFDPDALARIIQNLVDNAEKYSRGPAGRTITVELARREKGVALSVSDRGPGIAKTARAKLFRPFSRGQGPDQPEGIGLGLTLVDALARAHGGTVEYEDRPGGGARFTVMFPA